jgi:hypothetical protein
MSLVVSVFAVEGTANSEVAESYDGSKVEGICRGEEGSNQAAKIFRRGLVPVSLEAPGASARDRQPPQASTHEN